MGIYFADLHVHTNASPDGRSSLDALTAAAKNAGLHALAVTDHNLCTPVPPEMNGILLIPGCEVSTRAGHITALFLEKPLPVFDSLPAAENAIAAIHDAGGLAVLAHPYQRPGAVPENFSFRTDAVETANARAALKVPAANRLAAQLAENLSLPAAGGSDAHDAKEVGNACTVFTASELTLSALREALASGETAAVLHRDTPHIRKGLSQWTKARRTGIRKLPKAAAYLAWCAVQDLCRRKD
ncbi:MAG: CehA/McbA family metallohydrolase [Oscillospiraceae bacterium]|nr:CehA/McbA family metallohydrolase [Oscillospiraceae bacterium]